MTILFFGVLGALVWNGTSENGTLRKSTSIEPNWAAIAAWPNLNSSSVEAQPDPNRRVTAIVLDDSGSMSKDMHDAKQAVIGALDAMKDDDRVAVVALNSGTVLPFASVAEAKSDLPALLSPIVSDGGTPLTRAIRSAQDLLEAEAAAVRGFGTFRLIVTTDGVADDSEALDAEIETLATSTPIQVTTIGIGIEGGHVLRRADLGSFVDVSNVAALQSALEAAVAENTDFSAITEFGGQGE
ncbi:VWA domain-containing protein [Tritonibacter multivorans]|nr:vWA domain-containing protein [Tritonibacter multivorans]MDA7422894.1 VWA domain-containing protein [Tritonibacter multivorans]